MIEQVTKNLHLGFLFYAIYLGYNYQIELDLKLQEAIGQKEAGTIQFLRTKKELKQVKKFEENLEESKKRVQDVVAKIEKIQKQLPSDINDDNVRDKLISFSDELKMLNPSPSPKVEVNNRFYFSKQYNFDVQGTFLQFLIFFEKLEKMASVDRILNVKYLRMKISDNADPRSRFQILDLTTTVEAYRYNNDFDARDL